ncbi:MAG TPA: nucleotidyltransferase domain-containing protein [Candidatus Thermoplasmatota archaeon]|jgi:predicted nucleotidyltransferase|nr:nucleotidyltransferase domain-containing protein [Candidatus Thermoplasmatota archaeon]
MAVAADKGVPSLPPQLQAVVAAIRDRYRPERIILFGSHAWGTPGVGSDVDLFIVKDTDTPGWKRGAEVRALIRAERRGLAMDILVYTHAEVDRRLAQGDPFVAMVLREGRTLYGA